MSQAAVQAASMKKLFKKLKNLTNRHVSSTETVCLLSESGQPNPKNNKRLKIVIEDIPNADHSTYEKKPGSNHKPWKCKDKTIRRQIKDFKYYEACVTFCKLEDNGAGDAREFYDTISQKMWETVGKALAGDQNQSAMLQTISRCIKWASETQSKKDCDWGPQRWTLELGELFEADIKGTIPQLTQSTMDKENLKDDLKKHKRKISEITRKVQMFPVELTSIYIKCLHEYLLDDVTSMAERNLSYEEQILLCKFTREEHVKLCKYLQGSAAFDYMLYESWFSNIGDKITSTGQEAVRTALKNILEHEIAWNDNPNVDVQCHFYTIQEEMTGICEAVKENSATLVGKLNSLCGEEFLKFLTRYEDFLKHKVEKAQGMVSGNGVEMGLRIVNNIDISSFSKTIQTNDFRTVVECQSQIPAATAATLVVLMKMASISRAILLGLGNIKQESEILLEQCENRGIEIILRILTPKMKSAFKTYFNKSKSDYDLMKYWEALRKQGIENHKKLNTYIQHRITVLYIKSFFKSKCRNKAEAFIQGRRKLKELFTELVSDEDKLGEDPLEFMEQMLTASDYESLKTTTVYFIMAHEDLRKEHLEAILKNKGDITRKDRKNLLEYVKDTKIGGIKLKDRKNLRDYVKNKKNGFVGDRLKFFEDVHIGWGFLKYLWCFRCLCK